MVNNQFSAISLKLQGYLSNILDQTEISLEGTTSVNRTRTCHSTNRGSLKFIWINYLIFHSSDYIQNPGTEFNEFEPIQS